ncbi:MAG: hypothetical protein RIN56_03540 [Sporomusaceae bacterium]|nr:hypothetical protein [Sporomusaceae bacterium]
MKRLIMFVTMATVLCALAGTALAAESWATDPKTGAKVGFVHPFYALTAASWSGPVADGKAEGSGTLVATVRAGKTVYTIQIQGEMHAGLLNGKASGKWSDGDTFESNFINGVGEGRGFIKYATRNGRVYEGDFSNSLPNGQGVYKEANGKVIYEGEWKDGAPVTRPLLDKVLGIPWGASEDEVKKALLARPKTSLQWSGKIDGGATAQRFWGPFNNEDQWITAYFLDGKLFLVEMIRMVPESKVDEAMEKFAATLKGLAERYGPADIETGKYMDTTNAWVWPAKYAIRAIVERQAGANPPAFAVRLVYVEAAGYLKYEEKSAPASVKSEY